MSVNVERRLDAVIRQLNRIATSLEKIAAVAPGGEVPHIGTGDVAISTFSAGVGQGYQAEARHVPTGIVVRSAGSSGVSARDDAIKKLRVALYAAQLDVTE